MRCRELFEILNEMTDEQLDGIIGVYNTENDELYPVAEVSRAYESDVIDLNNLVLVI